MTVKTASVLANGIHVSYCYKSPGAVTVIFIHGFPFGKEIWTDQLNSLPGKIEGIAYDIRGYGGSDTGHHFFSIDLFVSDLLGLIQELSLSNVILCGISMGGYIALRAFERSPQLFAGLVLCDTNSFADSNEAKLNRFATIEQIVNGEKKVFSASFIKKIFSEDTINHKKQTVSFIEEMISRLPETTLCATQLALASRTETTAVLEKIDVPALIIRGKEDKLMTEEQALFLKNTIKKSQLAEIPQSGHLPNLENPETFNEILNRFLLENYKF